MFAPLLVNDVTSKGIKHDDPFLTVLRLKLLVDGQDEYAGTELGYLHFPIPSELQYFLFPAARIHLVQGNTLQVCGQLLEKNGPAPPSSPRSRGSWYSMSSLPAKNTMIRGAAWLPDGTC